MGQDSKKIRKRIGKHLKRDLLFSGKKYGVKRGFIENVEGEVSTVG